MLESPKLPIGPLEHPALDYAFLRQEGIRHLERIAGHLWTDFNDHDPGITILEQLCYAITDLAYRASYGVPDLLASGGGDPYRSLYSPATILTSHPVTLVDLRKLILDVEGVKNAWIEVVEEPDLPLHYHEARRELGFRPEPPYTAPVLLKGLVRVLVEKSDLLDLNAEQVRQDVTRRLHACRPLCTDFDEIRVLDSQQIQIQAEVEIGPVDDAEGVLLEIYDALSEHVSPSVPFATLTEMLAAGKRSDEIFDGPPLEHGFLDDEALERMRRKDAIYTSDLIRVIMDVAGVRAVRSITASADGGAPEPWRLLLDAHRAPRLDLHGSSITLIKGRLTARLDAADIIKKLTARRAQAASHGALPARERDLAPPLGRDRQIGRYTSIQHQFPAIYGIGAAGLPDTATPKRKAQAKQLKAYLMFFDQLLANYFAQLAHAASLFSFHQDSPRTYFAQRLDDPSLGLGELLRDAGGHQAFLDDTTERTADAGAVANRANRFLNHLMARFAEQFTDYSLVVLDAASRRERSAGDKLAADKLAFLQRYPRISSARGTGSNILLPRSADNISGLEERIRRKLGLGPEEKFFLIEHLLLMPLREDDVPPGEREYQQIPVLSESARKDPYSLALSFVFPVQFGRPGLSGDAANEFRIFVEQTLREETPAHLAVYLHWLSAEEWRHFDPDPASDAVSVYDDWLDALRSYRAAKLGLEPMSETMHFRARDARDRLIDLLELGETYPLRDLPGRAETLTVPFNQAARIPIEASQLGVVYELRSVRDDTLILREEGGQSVPVQIEGTGGKIFLVTPPMREDTTYNILARKIATGRHAYLRQQATVKVGLDVALRARILDAAPLVDPDAGAPADGDPRIVAYGAQVRVQIDHSQEGVDYRLVRLDGEGGEEQALSEDVRGDLSDIVLLARPVREDLDLRIRATRETHTALLDIVLPLKVRARTDLPVALEPSSVVNFGEGAALRIESTQTSASYMLYVGAVPDRDFVFGAGGPELLAADVEGEPRVHVRRPPQRPIWEDLDGFTPVGAPVRGNGGTLRLPMSALTRDSVILVRAEKEHQAAVNVSSSVQLQNAALLLVRPDPGVALRLGVVMDGARTTGTLEVAGGQPGVFYHVRREPDGADLGLPAYFHKTDDRDARLNKGIEQLRVEGDLAISRGPSRPASTSAELAATPPLAPLLETGPLDAGTTLHFRAVKAQTRAAARLSQTARIAPVPEIRAEPAAVAPGSPATIVVPASVAGERYELTLDGRPVGEARDGDGGELRFTTAPLAAETRFQVRVTRPGEPGIPVERLVQIRVEVAPGG
ncbi:hypothetical protein [Sorangium sp. So ce385]|uniref:hypothetical protein n=1 Tax=Sorangium sp. So ce385 TaxID=3133308 RepID=UPI003F5BDA89